MYYVIEHENFMIIQNNTQYVIATHTWSSLVPCRECAASTFNCPAGWAFEWSWVWKHLGFSTLCRAAQMGPSFQWTACTRHLRYLQPCVKLFEVWRYDCHSYCYCLRTSCKVHEHVRHLSQDVPILNSQNIKCLFGNIPVPLFMVTQNEVPKLPCQSQWRIKWWTSL